MLPYFLLFFSPYILASWSPRRAIGWTSFAASLFLSIFIGFRYQTGGDWTSYSASLLKAYGVPLREFYSFQEYEPLYALLNWIGANQFGGLVLVNSVCALIFSFSLLRFCRSLPKPWLALTLAIPYLVIVVAMGYTRQSVAIAFEMLALLALKSGQNVRFIMLILLGSLFHIPALSLLTLVVFSSQFLFISIPPRLARLVKLVLVVVAGYGFYAANSSNLGTFVDGYYSDYGDYSPQGAMLRIGVTAAFSLVFLLHKKNFLLSATKKIWTGLSLFALFAVIALILAFTNLG